MTQRTLFDGPDPAAFNAERAKDAAAAGIDRSAEGREDAFAKLLEGVRKTAAVTDHFTSDAVFKAHPELDNVREHRIMGAVMRVAAKNGWIEKTGTYLPGDRVVAHRRPMLVWRSKLKGVA